ncbi:uncharacterized protein LOC116337418 [Contarinia nasturtii]|uniref:uncharacterized protein LOC116337418 n=1 Tax=Contarinia nasturtii TaxID=265458 RepID=UPI0012D3BD57|nr:uncharacterized protein LOC116337418 [Contarinia nasturtii]
MQTMASMSWKSIGWPSICLMILHLFSICTCLKDLKIYVPEAVALGDAVTLSCYYNLENASLYSVRWYLEQEEFYRFVPKESPPSRVFAVAGISVDLTKSNEHTVTLRSVSRIISGKYQCEASADAPLFHTETSTAKMLVVELPSHNPVLTVSNNNSKNGIAIGELLKATCISSPSHPPVNFTWTINGNIWPSSNVGLRSMQTIEMNTVIPNNDSDANAKEAWSDMIVRIENHMLIPDNRKILIRCETNIFNLYRGAVEAELKISDDSIWLHGGKVSPTTQLTDPRSNSGGNGGSSSSSSTSKNGGDPDNSALQAGAGYRLNTSYILLQLVFLLLITPLALS